MNQFFLTVVTVFTFQFISAQPVDFKPDISRALFHSRLDEAQKALLWADGRKDKMLTPFQNEELNLQLTYYVQNFIDQWQINMEANDSIASQEKIGLIRGLTDLLNGFKGQAPRFTIPTKSGYLGWEHFPGMLEGFEQASMLNREGKSITTALTSLPYDGALLLTNSIVFIDNPFAIETRQYMLLKYLEKFQERTLDEMTKRENLKYPFADSLIAEAAKRNPDRLIRYAQASGTALSRKIFESKNPFVRLLADFSMDPKGQLYMPFLHMISKGYLDKKVITDAIGDSTRYYSLLVKTQIEYARRSQKGEIFSSAKDLTDRLKRKTMEVYVNTINGLHDYGAEIRFKSIQKLTPEELYYLMVLNEVEIYTSSYLYVYKRIFEILPTQGADSILALVHYDRYKKFLTMASNYNTLDDFLGRMSKESAHGLMINFVNNLDKGSGEDEIEDAVDVANAYATITDTTLRKLIRNQVDLNLNRALATNNRKASVIYRLEKLIMESNDPHATINISDSLGILPVYQVPNQYLKDDKGRVVMQMYFYGDAGGKGSFNTLMNLMSNRSQWKINSTAQWVQFTSIGTDVPFVLFANRALDEEQDLDDKAQYALIEWMNANGFQPSITVHRGHSYFLGQTIEKMLPSSKVVVLGSCGAYHNLANVLKISPEAYIIASKQVGYGVINIQVFMYLINELKRGRDVVWPSMMEDVGKSVGAGRKSDFEDYIFPHKNLGAIFIKAYRKAMEEKI